MINTISSQENPVVKHIKQLAKRKDREQYQEYVIEGIRMLWDALENHKELNCILFCQELHGTAGGEELLNHLMDKGLKLHKVPEKLYKELSDTQSPQGILATVSMNQYDMDKVLRRENGFYLVLDRIQDPGNMGTMIRTADAAGVDAVFVTKGSVDIYNSKVIRSTMGSIFHLPILTMGTTGEIIYRLKEKGVKIITTSLEAKKYHYEVDFRQSCAIIIGNEANGVLPEDMEASDILVKIPMVGKAESLNASIAASVMMYETVRQRIR